MEKLKKSRSVIRTNVTKLTHSIEKETLKEEIEASYSILEEKIILLKELDREIFNLLLEQDTNEVDLLAESESTEEYSRKFFKAKVIYQHIIKGNRNEEDSVSIKSSIGSKSGLCSSKRKFKLPMLELAKFGGNIKDWLKFWSMFQKIDNDTEIDCEDKFQYLVQATVPGSRARQLVESFPPTASNYPKAIESLKARFGREDLLIELYIRELLGLIIQNLKSKLKLPLETLYDKIELQLRALESLNVTSDKCSAILYPLIESCLPEYLLRIWQRSGSCNRDESLKSQLDNLLAFLKKEVENEERVNLAVTSFDIGSDSTSRAGNCFRSNYKKEHLTKQRPKFNMPSERNVPTALELVNCQERSVPCLFCREDSHKSENCSRAKNLSLKEKQIILKKVNACFSCLKVGHSYKQCRSNVKCNVCYKRHVTIMCFRDQHVTNENSKLENNEQSTNNVETVGLSLESTLSNNNLLDVSLQTLVVVIRGENHEKSVRALVDTGSQRSYILKSTAKEMSYKSIKQEEVVHSLFGGSLSQPQSHNVYKVRVKHANSSYACNFDVMDQETICNEISPIKVGPWLNDLKQSNIVLSDFQKGPIELLIGADVAGKLMTGRNLILKSGLVAVEMLLGWTLMGKYPTLGKIPSSTTMTITTLYVKDFSISQLWNLDVLGIEDPKEKKTRNELEQEAVDHFNKTVVINDEGRYEVEMPWLEDHAPLPSNYNVAQRRLYKTVDKLRAENQYDGYKKVFDNWVNEGIIEELSPTTDSTIGHYLPHRAVLKTNSTTPIRPVFDASAKEKGFPSLNDCLEKGVNLIDLIPDLLVRFRLEKIGVIADIKKAFLQISLKESDRNFLKFLWLDEVNGLKVYRHSRVVFGVTCSPFLLGSVINKHLDKTLSHAIEGSDQYHVSTIKKLMRSFYVDNCICSVSSTEELNDFVKESTQIFSEAKFELRGWEFSSESNNDDSVGVLGLNWFPKEDVLSLKPEVVSNKGITKVTKRIMLSVTHGLFDPIGFSAPVSLCPKLLLQEMWSMKLGWDDEVSEDIRSRFLSWYLQLEQLKDLKIPRWLSGSSKDWAGCSLHVFCDASKVAYATCIFLRIDSTKGTVINLVQAKCRVAPTKGMTIPRLELMAALIGTRLANSVIHALEPLNIPCVYWSDSSTVLSWIKRSCNWSVFVRNRVNEILQLTNKESWRHVAGTENPADLLSRGCSPKKLIESKWWEGPHWLLYPEEQWPQSQLNCNEDEIHQEKLKSVCSTLSTVKKENKDFGWYYKYFSSFNQIVRMLAWVRRFLDNCRANVEKKNGELSVDELVQARYCVIKLIQEESFVGTEDKLLKTLKVIKDESGVLRIETKIVQRNDTYEFKYPTVLPEKHVVVRRLIYEEHIKNCHVGTQGLLSLLRENYWILRGRKTVHSVIRKCVVCQRFKGKVLETLPSNLPENRVREAAVFEVIGIDFAGPVYLKGKVKSWICLFTCAIFRAVHFELVTSLSAANFLLALRRFISRRGRPHVIYSDNATNFTATENCFKKLDWDEINTSCSNMKIKWYFIPPSAPWWGGWWERLIKVMKGLFKKVLGKSSLGYEELTTVLCDCEAVVNSRPLTYLSEDPTDFMVLTPACFLQELKENGTPDIDKLETVSLEKRYRQRQHLSMSLRKRFRNEYLGQLTTYSKKQVKQCILKKGDVVLITSENKKKIEWPLAVVEELMTGRDKEVRVVRLKTSTGTLIRPIQKLCLLEMANWTDDRTHEDMTNKAARYNRVVKKTSKYLT